MEELLRNTNILTILLIPEEDGTNVTIKGEASVHDMFLTIKTMVKALAEISEVTPKEILFAQLFECI